MKQIQHIVLCFLLFSTIMHAQQSTDPYVVGPAAYKGSVAGAAETSEIQCNYTVGQAAYSQNNYLNIAAANETMNITIGFPYGVLYLAAAFKGELFASKGYYSDYIRLRWDVSKYSGSIEEFLIYRSKVGEADSFLVDNVAAGVRSWKDVYADAGILYKYTVYAKGVHPNPQKGINYIQGIGFRSPTGTVTGRITYSGGTAVEGVEVMAESETAIVGHSMYFNGNNYLYVEHKDGAVSSDEFTYQSYLRFDGPLHNACFFAKGNQYSIWYNNDAGALVFVVGDKMVYAPYVPEIDKYFQLTTVFTGDSALIYADGVQLVEDTITLKPNLDDASIIMGKNSETGHYFTGYIDEVRLWNKALDSTEVARDYSRILSGAEEGITAYWMFDEGYGDEFYDKSKTGYDFNENHGNILGALWTDVIPREEQLAVKGITDDNGNYIISGVPYETDGSTYTFTPTFGIHSFDPKKTILFIGEGSTIHNNINFTDISSFRVTGTAFYNNTTYPLAKATLYVDGKAVMGPDNLPVKTDDNGEFDIDVPIGWHYIAVKKDGHAFENEGQWPSPTEDEPFKKHDFQEPVTGIEFVDETLVKIAGRVVGGTREGDKPIGFGKSVNNIGTAKIEFQSEKTCDLDTDDTDIYDKIIKYTNTDNGEYELYLLPEKYNVNFVGNSDYSIPNDDLTLLDLTGAFDENYDLDSTEVKTIDGNDTIISFEVDTFYYNVKKNYIVRVKPSISVVHPDTDEEFFAEEEMIIPDPEEPANTDLYDTIDLKNNSPFRYPLFEMGTVYKTKICLFEEYINTDYNGEHELVNGQEKEGAQLTDRVPVTDAQITINNHLEINEPSHSVKPDAGGTYNYKFRVGLPNLSKDEANNASFTKTFEIDINAGGNYVKWRDGDIYRAYVLGEKSKGNNFFTKGPQVPEIILRDPPGTNSYAYIEKGSTYSITENWSSSFNSHKEYDYNIKKGAKFKITMLAGPMQESEFINDTDLGIQLTNYVNESGEYGTSYTFTERIETSSDPNSVGSMADLFIGRSYNSFFGETDNLRILPKNFAQKHGLNTIGDSELEDQNAGYTLSIRPGFVCSPDTAATFFVYSQNHILNYLIPNLIELRNNLFVQSPEKYKSNIDMPHPYYALNNDNEVFENCTSDTCDFDPDNPSYVFTPDTDEEVDSVRMYNQQISIWLGTIAINEAEKAEAELIKNISIDGTAGAYTGEATKEKFGSTDYEMTRNIEFHMNGKTGFLVNGAGLEMENKSSFDWGASAGHSDSYNHHITFGYVIDDNNHGDYYSIDVKDPNKNGLFNADIDDFLSGNNEETGKYVRDFWTDNAPGGAIGVASFGVKKMLPKIFTNYKTIQAFTFVKKAFVGMQVLSMGYDLGLAIHGMLDIKKFASTVQTSTRSHVYVGGWNISSPVFSVKAGQTMCPYEGEEWTSFYFDTISGNAYELNKATVKREVPVIDVEPSIVSGVPDYSSATFELLLKNESESGHDQWYQLQIDEKSNPHGAALKVDGMSPNRVFYVPAGQTLRKTLTISKGQEDVMDYDSLCLVLHSTCQFDPTDNMEDIADSVYVSAHFQPTCSPVAISNIEDNWIVNADNNDTLLVNIDSYDLNHAKLEKILFQYKTLSGVPVNNMVFYKNEADYEEADAPKTFINGNTEMTYLFPMGNLQDRQYQLRAKTTCSDGSTYELPYLTGVKDAKYPKLFGTPSPADGILSPEDEIMVQFDEQIEAGLVSKLGNIEFTGVLNGSELNHGTSVAIDELNEKLSVNHEFNLTDKSFTVEFWINRLQWEGSGDFFRIGNNRNAPLLIGYDATGKLYVKMNGGQITADYDFKDMQSWHHIACSYDKDAHEANLYINGELMDYMTLSEDPQVTGQVVFGEISYYHTAMHELRLWDLKRSFAEITSNMNFRLTGQEPGLIGYWPMDEAIGTLCRDYAGNRHAVIDETLDWLVQPYSFAAEFQKMGNYIEINSGSAPVTNEMDFTIEFWVKLNGSGREAYVFSNGKGDGSDSRPDDTWSAYFDENGLLKVNHKGIVYQASQKDFNDHAWHHFALVVNRLGTAKIFVDGNLQQSFDSGNLGGFAGSRIWLGARGWFEGSQVQTDNTFFGYIDEFRVWNLARTAEQIKRDMVYKLSGQETGLIVYYPFEQYKNDGGILVSDTTLMDQSLNDNEESNCGGAAVNDGISLGYTSPKIKRPRPVEKVNYDFAINTDKMIITPKDAPARVENCILDITVRDVFDMNGNRLQSPVTWTAYIDKNQVKWDEDELKLSKKVGDPMSFTVSILNTGGTNQYYMIKNLPAWLQVAPAQGYIAPDSEIEIEFVVHEGLNIGSYTQDIYLEADFGFNEKLRIQLNVSDTPPAWDVDPAQYEYSMNIFGKLSIEGIFSTDIYDMVGVFVNDTCRGVANVTYYEANDAYLVYLDIFSNVVSDQQMTFKVWDASTGTIHNLVEPEITFVESQVLGTPLAPLLIDAKDLQEQIIEIQEGWNWFSLNLTSDEPDAKSTNNVLKNLSPERGDAIVSLHAFDQYSESTQAWAGGITAMNGLTDYNMYMLNIAAAGKIKFGGRPIRDLHIPINTDWNWIAYLPQVSMSVNDALAYYNAEPGDIIKSQKQFAMYDDRLGWVGSLEYMQPGFGYKLHSSNGQGFTYPAKGLFKAGENEKTPDLSNQAWKVPVADFRYDMTMVSELQSASSQPLSDDNIVLGAFANDACIGLAFPEIIGNRVRYFINIYSNSADYNELSFKAIDMGTDEISTVTEKTSFHPDKHIGTVDNPVVLHINAENSSINAEDAADQTIQVSPNPFAQSIDVDIQLTHSAKLDIVLLDAPGRVIQYLYSAHHPKGAFRKHYSLLNKNGGALAPGIYFLRVRIGSSEKTIKLVKGR